MRSMRFLAFATLLAVSGCASVFGSDTAVVSASPQTVTIRFTEGHLQAATERAQDLCATHQGSAQLRTVTPGRGQERIAAFSCV